MRILFATVMLLLVGAVPAVANYIQINNVQIAERGDGYAIIQFDLSWQNSWRTNILNDPTDSGSQCPIRNNWDAAWVFMKWRRSDDAPQGVQAPTVPFSHAMLADDQHHIPVNTATADGLSTFTYALGKVYEFKDYQPDPELADYNPYVGMFIYAETSGSGNVMLEGVRIKWNYSEHTDLQETDQIDVRVFGIEMVYVPEGPFWVGSGASEKQSFTDGAWTGPMGPEINYYLYEGEPTIPFQITGAWDRVIEHTPGKLWATGTISSGTLDEYYPTGYDAFYMTKHVLTQGAYKDFLNTLTGEEAADRFAGITGSRQNIRYADGQYYMHNDQNEHVIMGGVSWQDGCSYSSWAGLRPVADLEWEKAARGPVYPVPEERAWGTKHTVRPDLSEYLINSGKPNEAISDDFVFGELQGPCTRIHRVGMYASSTSNRIHSGASYWGIFDITGHQLYGVQGLNPSIDGQSVVRHGYGIPNSSFWQTGMGNALLFRSYACSSISFRRRWGGLTSRQTYISWFAARSAPAN